MPSDVAGKATIDFDGINLILRWNPYNNGLVDSLKSTVPYEVRKYDRCPLYPGERGKDYAWFISEPIYLADIIWLCEAYDYQVRDYTGSDSKARERQEFFTYQRLEREAAAERGAAEQLRKSQEQRRRDDEKATGTSDRANEKSSRQYAWDEPEEEDDLDDWDRTEDYFRRAAEGAQAFRDAWDDFFKAPPRQEPKQKPPPREKPKDGQAPHSKIFYEWETGRYYTTADNDGQNRYRAYLNNGHQQSWQGGGYYQRPNNSPPKTETIDPAWSILGCKPSESYEEVKRRHRQLARQWHPDVPGGDLKKMVEINNAWDKVCSIQGWEGKG